MFDEMLMAQARRNHMKNQLKTPNNEHCTEKKDLNIFDAVIAGELQNPLLISKKNLSNILGGQIREVNRVNRGLNNDVVESIAVQQATP